MRQRDDRHEPLCETSEISERLIARVEILTIGREIGQRLLDLFDYQQLSNIVFRLKTNRSTLDAIINGDALPSTELLLGIQRVTDVSIDWLLTGRGEKFRPSTSNGPTFEDQQIPWPRIPPDNPTRIHP